MCISFTRPALPKSMSDMAADAARAQVVDDIREEAAGVTRQRQRYGPSIALFKERLPAAERVGDGLGVPNRPAPLTGDESDGAGSTRRQSISSCGISRRNRDSGLSIG